MLVDTGTSLYGEGPERLRQRGTAAHNTVVVDDQDSSEVWRGFRVARRAYPRDVRVDASSEPWTVSAAHDGYRRLPGRVIHRRRWEFGSNSLLVADRVEGKHASARARFHFHPRIEVRCVERGRAVLSGADGLSCMVPDHERAGLVGGFDLPPRIRLLDSQPMPCCRAGARRISHRLFRIIVKAALAKR